jgi:hypothetical protein
MNKFATHTLFIPLVFVSIIQLSGQSSSPQSVGFVRFWKDVISRYSPAYLRCDSVAFVEFCKGHNLDLDHDRNKRMYATLGLLHNMLTAPSPDNCATDGILQIPYYWHWGPDRPRQHIIWSLTGQRLDQISPPAAFKRYRSYADIDRTPDIFWQNLLSERPMFYTATCDSFYTFGWCSEREMAFQAFLHTLGFYDQETGYANSVGRVIAEGPHSWSEMALQLTADTGKPVWLICRIDNTYGSMKWRAASDADVMNLKNYTSQCDQECKRYNRKASSPDIHATLRALRVSAPVQQRIATQLDEFFR